METIPLDRIRISASNVRANDPFGDEEDQALIENIGSYGVLQPIIVRPVGDMYELIAGRRRLLSARESGLTEIPCVVKDLDEEEALDISLIENIHRKDVDPVTLGRAVKLKLEKEGISLGKLAKRMNMPKATLHTWHRMNDLSPAMQSEVQSGTVPLRDALKVASMNLPLEVESTLAEEARVEGFEAFKRSLDRISAEEEKRGAPKGLKIIRISWGQASPEYEALRSRAEEASIELGEYCQKVLIDHLKEL